MTSEIFDKVINAMRCGLSQDELVSFYDALDGGGVGIFMIYLGKYLKSVDPSLFGMDDTPISVMIDSYKKEG